MRNFKFSRAMVVGVDGAGDKRRSMAPRLMRWHNGAFANFRSSVRPFLYFAFALLSSPLHAGFSELMNAANAAMSRGDLVQAAASYAEAARLETGQSQAWYGLGMCEYRLGRFAEAMAHLGAAAELAPGFAPARQLYGLAAEKLWDQAFATIHKGGVLKYRLGRWLEAAEAFRLALEIRPQDPNAHYNLGAALFHVRDWDGSDRAARASIRSSPSYAAPRFLLARVFEERGNKEAARTLYTQVINMASAGAFADQSRNRLASLEDEAKPRAWPLHLYAKATAQAANSAQFAYDPQLFTHSLDLASFVRLSWDPKYLSTEFSLAYSNYYFWSSSLTGTTQIDYHGLAFSARPPLGAGFFAATAYDFAYALNPMNSFYTHHLASLQLQAENKGPSLLAVEAQGLWESYPSYPDLDSRSFLPGFSATQYFSPRAYATFSYQYRANSAALDLYSYRSHSAHATLRLRAWQHLSPQLDLNYQKAEYAQWPLANGGTGREDRIALGRLELTLLQFDHAALSVGDEAWQDDSNVEAYAAHSNTCFASFTCNW